MHTQTVIIGNVGVGKTTLMEGIQALPMYEVVPADVFFQTNPFFPLSKQDGPRWSFANDLWFLVKRVQMTREFLPKRENKPIVVDSGVLMSYAYARAHQSAGFLTAQEWELFEVLFDTLTAELPKPDLVVMLDASFEVLRTRIEKRNRAFEVQGYFKYLKSVGQGIEALATKLQEVHVPLLRLDTSSLSSAQVAEKVLGAIGR